jgi:leader peptidase (prepilin peptidase)/N-methyltransferase
MLLMYIWLVPLLVWLFLIGAAVGSFLNVCIYRIAQGKSLVWPGSRCGHCFHEVRLKDNIPLVSYWVLRGRCRDCGARFSSRYFWVELFTALTFVALYVLEIGLNVERLPIWPGGGFAILQYAQSPPCWSVLLAFHAVLACFLITATACLLDYGRVPTSVAITGTLAGLVGAALLPWPFPLDPSAAVLPVPGYTNRPVYFPVDGDPSGRLVRGAMPAEGSWATWPFSPRPGFVPWPAWGPLPDALAPGSWRLGLVTGLAGAVVGGWGLRLVALVGRLGRGRDIVPAGSASLSMIAGAFLGWQPLLVALVLAFGFAALFAPWGRFDPFGPGLVLGVVTAWLGWAWIGPLVRPALFSPALLPPLLAVLLALVAVVSLLAGLIAAKR